MNNPISFEISYLTVMGGACLLCVSVLLHALNQHDYKICICSYSYLTGTRIYEECNFDSNTKYE